MRSGLVTALVCVAGISVAGLAPENTVLVVNGDSWASLTVANEYVKLRHIPGSNVIVLHGVRTNLSFGGGEFRSQVLEPVFKEMERRGIRRQIDCITYSVDFPYTADINGDLKGIPRAQIFTGRASINGLTYLHEWEEKVNPNLLQLDTNLYCRRRLPLPAGSTLSATDQATYTKALSLYDQKQYAQAISLLNQLLTVPRTDGNIGYNLACCYALSGNPTEAVNSLKLAVKQGWRNYGQTASDPDLASLAKREDYQEILRVLRNARVDVQPFTGFRSRYAWSLSGEPTTDGPHYMLSTVLGFTGGRGNSVEEVLACLRRSVAADYTSPKGTVYFMKNGDVRSTTREWGFDSAVGSVQKNGVGSAVVPGTIPMGKTDIVGSMIGIAAFNWSTSGSKIVPGAIAEHFTSFGGIMLERFSQTPCTELIRAGASGTSGTVDEPYALQEKFPTPFIQREYTAGATLAEAYYSSVSGPYQLLILGDPMCQPWAKKLGISVKGLPESGLAKGVLSLVPVANRPVKAFEVYVDGQYVTETKTGGTVKVNLAAQGDGYHTLAVVAVEANALESRTTWSARIRTGSSVTSLSVAKTSNLGEVLNAAVKCAGAQSIDIYHLGRVVGTIKGESGVVKINTTDLGIGEARLQAIATLANRRSVRSDIYALAVDPPRPLTAVTRPASATVPGLTLITPNHTRVLVNDTFDGGWLGKALSNAPGPFTLTGYFDAAKSETYQLQIEGNISLEVDVDGATVLTAHKTNPRTDYACVTLPAGSHQITLRGNYVPNMYFIPRLGVAGAAAWSDRQFKTSR